MKSLKRLFGRKSARKINRRLPFRVSRPIGYASHVERLEDRTLLASNILASLESSVNQPNDTTELTLNVGPGSSPTLGFEVKAAANSVFDPAAVRIFDANTNAVVPLELAENDHNGSMNSLVLANLGPGEYRIEVTGQTSDTGGFVIDVFLPGDSDGSGSVSDTEYQHALAAMQQHLFGFNSVTAHLIVQQMGLDPSTNFYSEELDSDRDGDVDNDDLSLMSANRNIPAVQFELIGDQEPPQIIAGLQIDSGVSDSDGITNDLTILGNISDESLITQFKVGLDGAPLVDFVDIFSLISGGANGGSFTLARSWIETNLNNGNSLEGGTHTLSFFAQDEHDNNNVDSFFDVTFELDVTDPTATGTPITNQNEDEDFGSLDLGPLTDFFNQNGGTALSFQVDSITNPIVTVDFSSGNLVLNSIQDAFGSTDIVILAMDLAGNSVLSNLFTVDVNPQNDAPVAIDDTFTTDEDTVLNGGTNVFAANPTTPDSDVENDAFTVTEVNGNAASVGNQITLTSGALLTLNSNGTFTYNPNGAFDNLADGQSDTDSFTYTIDDGTGSLITTDSATVTITINGVNDDASIGGDNAGDMTEDEAGDSGTLTITDVDDGEDVFVTQSSTVGTHGTFSIDAAGNWTYTRTADLNALNAGDQVTDTFTVISSDGTATEDVTITINGLNDDASIGGDNAGDMTEDEAGDSGTLTITDVDDGEDVFVTQSSTVGTHGTFSIDAAGNWTYTRTADLNALNAGDQVTDTFTVTSSDGTATEDVTITINGLNDDASIGGDNAGDMTEDEAGDSGTLTITDVDDGEDVFVTQSSTVGTHGTFSIDAAGNWTYTRTADLNALNAGDQVTDTFTVTSSDGTATEDVTITINGLNDDASIGGDNAGDMTEDEAGDSGTLTITDVDDGEDVFVTQSSTVGTHGTFSIDAAGNWTYTRTADLNALNAGDQVTDTFTVTSSDGTATEDVTITINGLNDDALIGGDNAGDMTEDEAGDSGTLTITDVDDGEDVFVTQSSTVGTHGTFSIDAAGNWTYTRTADLNALNAGDQVTDTFTVTSSDGTATEDVTITINGLNDDALIGGDNAGDMTEDEAGDSGTLTITDVDDGEDVFVTQSSTVGTHGTFSIDAAGNWTYTRTADLNALNAGDQVTDTFTVTSSDGTATEDVTITIDGMNDPPVAEADAFTTDEDTSTGGDLFADNGSGVDSDPDSSASFTITEVNGVSGDVNNSIILGSGATLTVNSDGTFTYDPSSSSQFNALAAGAQDTDSFSYTIDDGLGGTDTATVTITIDGVNDPPVAEADAFTTDEDTSTGGDLFADNGSGVDSDPDNGASFTITEVNGVSGDVNNPIILGSGATLTVNSDGTFTYDPSSSSQFNALADGEQDTDSFTYTIDDGLSGTDVATVTITVNGVNDPPVAQNDAVDVNKDFVFNGDVFANNGSGVDSDPDTNDVIFVSQVNGESGDVGAEVTLPTFGALLTLNLDGTFTYNPNGQFNHLSGTATETDTFTYQISDGNGGFSLATVTVTISANQLPVANPDNGGTTDEETALNNIDVLSNDTDPDGVDEDLIVSGLPSLTSAGGATLSLNPDGTINYDPSGSFDFLAAGEQTTDTFTYTVRDVRGGESTGTVTVTINGLNDDASIGGDNAGDMTEDEAGDSGTLTITDVDDGEDVFVTQSSTVGTHGTFSIDAAGNWTYTRTADLNALNAGDQVTDTFTVTSSDGTATEDVTITINGLNDDASIGGDNAGDMTEDEAGDSGTLTITDVDDGEDVFVTQSSTVGTHGTFSIDAAGNWTYTRTADLNALNAGDQVTDTFTVTSSDGTATEDVTITINGLNDDALIGGDNAGDMTEDEAGDSGTLTITDVDDGEDVFVTQSSTVGTHGTFSIDAAGNWTYTRTADLNALNAGDQVTDTFTVTSSDGTATEDVTITINGLNDDALIGGDNAGDMTEDEAGDSGTLTITDVDDGEDVFVTQSSTVGTHGTFSIDAAGNWTYTRTADLNALNAGDQVTDTFTVTSSDGTATEDVTITINGLNDDASIGGDNAGDMTEDEAGDSGTLTITDVDDGEDVFVTQSSTVGTHGTFSIDAAGNWTYTRTADLNALNAGDQVTDTFTVTSSDGTATEDVTITINGLNDDASIGGDNAGDMTEDEAGDSGTLTITDVDDGEDVFVTQSSTVGTHGTFSIDAAGNWTYTRTADLNALNAGDQVTDTFTVTSSDGTATEDVTITITGVNDPPVAEADAFTTDEDTSTGGDLFADNGSGVDSDPDSSASFTITEVNGVSGDVNNSIILGSGATLTVNSDGTFTYDPSSSSQFNALAAGAQDTDSFTYTIDDGLTGTDTATVTITINGVNDPPVAEADAFTTDEDTSTGGDLFADNGSGVDSDPDNGASFTITEVNGVSGDVNNPIILGSGATLTVNSDGTFTYDPSSSSQFNALADGEQDTDSFTYTIDDGLGGTDVATVTITINGVNDPVTAQNDAVTTSKNNTINIDVTADNGNGPDTDPDTNDVLSVTHIADSSISTTPIITNVPFQLTSGALLTLNVDGTLTYDPNGQFNGLTLPTDTAEDTFTYTIDDGNGSTNTAIVTVTVTGSNELLMVVGDGLPDIERDGLTSEVINLDNFFSDADAGDTITYQVSPAPTLVGGDPLPANFWANNISIENGNELHIDYSIFSDIQVRLPVEITVTATSSDTVSPDVSSTFTLTPDPQITAEVRLLTRSTASSGRDFVFFRVEPAFGTIPPGAAQLQLTNNLQDLDFTIFMQDNVDNGDVDFDGTTTPGNSDDDLRIVRIIDTTTFSTVFTIYDSTLSNDGIVKDDINNTLSGTWEGLSSEIVDKLYNGDLAIQFQTQNGANSILGGENISVSPEVASENLLPTSQTEFVNGENYVVEIWVSDQLAQSLATQSGLEAGIQSTQVDLHWEGDSVARLLNVFISGEATAFGATSGVGGSFGNTGVVSNISGLSFVPGIAKDGGYARLGYVLFRAESEVTDVDPLEFTISMTPGDDSVQRSGPIDFSQISLIGTSVTHTQSLAAPLHGTNGQEQGTTVDLVVVQEQSEIDSTGHAIGSPKSDAWIDEWSSFWVEIYVETPDASAIAEALVDLNYNTEFFTATEIEFGSAFADNGNALIDDSTGIVTSLHATATFEGAGSQRTALLARVKFESLEQDDVAIDFEEKFIGPHDLGLSLSNVQVALTDGFHTYLTDDIIVGDSPETDLWAIAYDVNDDDAINFHDLMILASIYGENVLDTNSPYVWALDADKSGTVNFKDLSFFATNYGVYKGGNQQVAYPPNFLQRWYGNTTDITGSSSINEVMDEALGIWQDALGLEQPLDIQLVITDLGGTQLGEGQITAVDEEGRPIAGIVTLDDDAAGLGWYSDISTTAFGGTELEGGVAHTADSNSDAVGRYDLLTVLLHEIGHVAGFTQTYAPFGSHVEVGVGGTLSFVGSGFEATLTNDGLHLDDTVHAGDIMNATLDPGVRKLPSVLDTLILQTAHETAANGNFEIQVGVNAPLMANLPTTDQLVSDSAMNQQSTDVIIDVESLVDLEPSVIQISSSLSDQSNRVLSQFNLASNLLNLKDSRLDQDELDLTVLEDLVSDLRQNGLAIVGSGETNTVLDSDSNETELELFGLNEQVEAGFDDVFSDWTGPIL